jgi:hypothetical protein
MARCSNKAQGQGFVGQQSAAPDWRNPGLRGGSSFGHVSSFRLIQCCRSPAGGGVCMLLKIGLKTGLVERVRSEKLRTFNVTERDLQNFLFRSLDRLLSDEELLLIMQSRLWQEEPDLMALDKDGRLYIFELKAWESQSQNLLQVLRYGQIYGSHTYDDLQRIYANFEETGAHPLIL